MDKDAAKLFRNARREGVQTLGLTVCALIWTVGYCYLYGYTHTPDDWVVRVGLASVRDPARVYTFAGIPDWVFIGILFPWLLCTTFTVGFCLGMTDDELGQEAPEEAGHGH